MRIGLLALGICVGLIAARGDAQSNGAAMFRGGGALTGFSAVPTPRSLTGIRFRYRAGSAIRGTPAVAGGRLYFGAADGAFHAIDTRSGQRLWRFDAGAGIASSPAVVGGLVYFSTWGGKLFALDAASGRKRWTAALGRDRGNVNYWDFYLSSPNIVGRSLYIGSGDGGLYALDPATGKRRWRAELGARVRATPAVSGSRIVVGTLAGELVALDAANGREIWRYRTQGASQPFSLKQNDTTSIIASPSIADGIVTVGARDGNLYGVDLASGRERWKITHDGGSWILSTAIVAGRVYSGSGSAFIIQSADLASGREIWRHPTGGAAVFGAVSLAGESLLFNTMRGTLSALDTRNGDELWRYRMSEQSFSSPVIASGVVYSASDDGSVYAFDTASVATAPRTRLLYARPKRTAEEFSWFPDDIRGVIGGAFDSAGYVASTEEATLSAMRQQIQRGGRTVIILADNRLPDAAATDGEKHVSLARRYLDHGGTLVMLGLNPMSMVFDPKTGDLAGFDDELGAHAFGLSKPDRQRDYGYHVSMFSTEARAWGLAGEFSVSGAIDPADASIVLARDHVGMATAWAKRFPGGGVLLNLPISRARVQDLAPYASAIDIGLGRMERAAGAVRSAHH